MNTFKFIGNVKAIQDTDKFKGYEVKEYDSGWINRRLNFNMICGDNRHMISVNGGRWKDDSKASVFIFTKGSRDEKGNFIKGETKEVPWNERMNAENIEMSSRVYVIDLDTAAHRAALKRATSDDAGTEELMAAGVANIDEAKAKYVESCNKHIELISEWDFAGMIQSILGSDKYANRKFMVTGEYAFDYNPTTGKYYQKFNANKFVVVPDDMETCSVGTLEVYYTGNAVGEPADGLYPLEGYVRNYNNQLKRQIASHVAMKFGDPNNEKFTKRMISIFSDAEEDEFKKLRVEVDFIDGAQRKEITYDDLTDEQRDNIECGLCDFEMVKREMGGQIYGERSQYVLVKKLAYGSSGGPEDSGFTGQDFATPTISDTDENKNENLDDIDDLFGGIEL